MNKKQLELMADRIDAALNSNGIKARVDGGTVTPRTVIFNVSNRLDNGNRLVAAELALALGVPSVTIAGNTITVKRDAKPISLLALLGQKNMHGSIPPFTVTLGMCDDGAPLLIRLPSKDVGHILITGRGADDLLRTIAVSLSVCNRPRNLRLVTVGRFDDLAQLPHTQYYSMDDIVPLLGRSDISPRVVILIDVLDMHDSNLARILQGGHKSGIHVIAAGNGSSAGFSTIIKSSGEPGDFIALADGQEVRFTAAHISPAEIEQVVIGSLPIREPSRLQRAAGLV